MDTPKYFPTEAVLPELNNDFESVDPFAPDEEIDPFSSEGVDPFAFGEEEKEVIFPDEDIPDDLPIEEFPSDLEPPDPVIQEKETPISIESNGFLSELTQLSKQFEAQEIEVIVLPEIDEKFLEKKKESALPPLFNSQNEKVGQNSQNEKPEQNSQNENSELNSQNENSEKLLPSQRVFFEGFQQIPVSVQTTLVEARTVSSLGTPLSSEWAYDVARGPIFSFVTKNDPESINERGIIESIPALILRLGFLRFQYHLFSLQAYRIGHLGIGQVLEQFSAMLETAMRKFAGLSAVTTYGIQTLHMESPGPGVFISEETVENLHWLLCEEERFHLVLLPELSRQMAAAGQPLVYEALLQFSSSTALRFAWLTTTYSKLFSETIYKREENVGWVCLSCGHVLFEKEPFDCPFCAALPCSFVELKQFGYFIENAKLIES